jgi:hypothetical protein
MRTCLRHIAAAELRIQTMLPESWYGRTGGGGGRRREPSQPLRYGTRSLDQPKHRHIADAAAATNPLQRGSESTRRVCVCVWQQAAAAARVADRHERAESRVQAGGGVVLARGDDSDHGSRLRRIIAEYSQMVG